MIAISIDRSGKVSMEAGKEERLARIADYMIEASRRREQAKKQASADIFEGWDETTSESLDSW